MLKSIPLSFICALQICLLASCDNNSSPSKARSLALSIGSDETFRLTDKEHLRFVWIDALDSWVGETEVTLGQLRSLSKKVNRKPDSYAAQYVGRENNLNPYPAVMVSWHLAKKICDLLNKKYSMLLPKGYFFRLPSEEEWEAFARCGEEWLYPWGNTWPPSIMADGVLPNLQGVEQIEIKATNAKPLNKYQLISGYKDGWSSVAPVTKSGANQWGLYGIGGNVSEWCEGWFDKSNKLRLLKGASAFTNLPSACKISSRKTVKGQSPASGLLFWGTIRNQGHIGSGFRIIIGPKIQS